MSKIRYILLLSVALWANKPAKAAVVFAPANNSFLAFASTDSTILEDKKFNLYVNQGVLNIKSTKPQELKNGEVVIYNLLGQEVTRKKLEANALNQVPVSLQNTCYLVRISYSGKVYTQKVIVRD